VPLAHRHCVQHLLAEVDHRTIMVLTGSRVIVSTTCRVPLFTSPLRTRQKGALQFDLCWLARVGGRVERERSALRLVGAFEVANMGEHETLGETHAFLGPAE
jgi:hypothetical protein